MDQLAARPGEPLADLLGAERPGVEVDRGSPSVTTSRGVTVRRCSGTGRTALGSDGLTAPPSGKVREVPAATLFSALRACSRVQAKGRCGVSR